MGADLAEPQLGPAEVIAGVDQDKQLLTLSGQMPLRKDVSTAYASYFTANPDYKLFADQAARTVEVPNVGHAPSLTEPESLAAIKKFFDV